MQLHVVGLSWPRDRRRPPPRACCPGARYSPGFSICTSILILNLSAGSRRARRPGRGVCLARRKDSLVGLRSYLGFFLIALALAGLAGMLGLASGRPAAAAQSDGGYAAGPRGPAPLADSVPLAGETPCPPPWTAQAPYPMDIMDQAAASQGGRLYVFAGVSDSAIINSARKYDPGTDTWTAIRNYPLAVQGPAAVSDDTYVY